MKKITMSVAIILAGAASVMAPTHSHAAISRPLNWECTSEWVCMYAEQGGIGDVVSSSKCGIIDIPPQWHGRILGVADRVSQFSVLLEHHNPDGTNNDIAILNAGDNLELSPDQVANLDFAYRTGC
jgi:hypothetical protein